MDLTNEDVTDILALLDSLPYDELDLQTSRFRLTLRRTADGWTQSMATRAAPTVVDVTLETVSGAPETGPMEHQAGSNRPSGTSGRLGCETDGTDGAKGADGELVAVQAPLPGTFYRAPRPGAAPFVEVGGRVGADTVVGIVETMKLFNSVTAGVSGTVAEICLPNAEFADRGATLLRIRAD
jgi:acetyl-CoA carboxylase biotin carboxyl carrier protein